MSLKKTSQEWTDILFVDLKLKVMDPDGWDRSNWKYSFEEEKVSVTEFRNRVARSTCMFNLEAFQELDRRVEACVDEAEKNIERGRMPQQLDFLDALGQ
jgi:hypothetical protein